MGTKGFNGILLAYNLIASTVPLWIYFLIFIALTTCYWLWLYRWLSMFKKWSCGLPTEVPELVGPSALAEGPTSSGTSGWRSADQLQVGIKTWASHVTRNSMSRISSLGEVKHNSSTHLSSKVLYHLVSGCFAHNTLTVLSTLHTH